MKKANGNYWPDRHISSKKDSMNRIRKQYNLNTSK